MRVSANAMGGRGLGAIYDHQWVGGGWLVDGWVVRKWVIDGFRWVVE